MIEICRYILAAIVAQTHLWPLGSDWTGQISVFAFYTLSGYLMTRVLNDRYGFTMRGTAAFLFNRVLRLWPAYLVALALVITALPLLPLSNFFFLIRMPANAIEIITNVTIIGQVTFDFAQWLPLAKPLVTSWSLSIEMCCYLLLALYFAKSATRLWALIGVGVIAMAISTGWCATSINSAAYGPYCFQNRYGVVQAGFVPFGFGGLYYFYRSSIAGWIVMHRALALCLLATAIAAMFTTVQLAATVAPFIGIPMTWILLASAPNASCTRVQDFFGRASYHLFIAHMPVAAVLVTGLHIPAQSIAIYLATLAVALGLSVFLVPMERVVNGVRQRIALSAREAPPYQTPSRQAAS
jgi:peptidoglycan/LPS O-acetylase OafA/YrhL